LRLCLACTTFNIAQIKAQIIYFNILGFYENFCERLLYIIDVNSGDIREAAEYTHRIMSDPDSLRPVLHVIDSKGNSTEVDLSKDSADRDDNEETQGDRIFTGPMKGGLWNGRCMDACIMSKKQGDKVAYEFLIKFGNQYASSLSNDQQRQWQEIKNHAAGLLQGSRENTEQKNGGNCED